MRRGRRGRPKGRAVRPQACSARLPVGAETRGRLEDADALVAMLQRECDDKPLHCGKVGFRWRASSRNGKRPFDPAALAGRESA